MTSGTLKKALFWGYHYKRGAFWCLFSGLVYSVSFFRSSLFVFGFTGLFLFYLKLFENEDDKGGAPKYSFFKKSFFFGVGFFIPLYSWFTALYPFEAFELTKAQGILAVAFAVLGIGLYHTLLFAGCFSLLKILPGGRAFFPVSAGVCMMLYEWVISLGGFSLPWGTAAVSQHAFLPLLQNASLFGSYFIAFIVSAFCVSLALYVKHRKLWLLSFGALSLGVPLLIGCILLALPQKGGDPVRAAALQGNVLSMEKWDKTRLDEIIENYAALAEEAAQNGAQLIVLPESAIPGKYTEKIRARFTGIAQKYGVTLIMTALTTDREKNYNSVFAIYPGGGTSEIYSKRHLVPFGEYLPMQNILSSIFPFLANINLAKSPFSSGENTVITLEDGEKLGCLICFDSIFPPLALDSVRDGASLLLVTTNDSWYEDSAGVLQHMAHSAVRAAETGKWLIRAANTGVSCFISPNGVVHEQTKPLTRGIVYYSVVPNNRRTLYSYIGGYVMTAPFLYLLAGLLIFLRSKAKKQKVSHLPIKNMKSKEEN